MDKNKTSAPFLSFGTPAICFFILLTAAFLMIPVSGMAKTTSPEKIYRQYLKKHVGKKKYYQIVNIGEENTPVLLIGKGEKTELKEKEKIAFNSCKVYACIDGEVKKMETFDEKYGGRLIGLYQKNGKNYLGNGLSDARAFYRIRKGKIITHQYFNCRSGEKDDLFAESVVKKGGQITKNLGYLDASRYEKRINAYTTLDSAIGFLQNLKE